MDTQLPEKAGELFTVDFLYRIPPKLTKAEAKINETIVITLITMFIDGPEVSLNGSPIVSPTTAAL
jgi:hypothetical protein